MAEWIAEQRRLFERNELPLAKIVLLEPLPNWNINAQTQEREAQWRNKLALLVDFVATEQRMPRYRTYATKEEHILGIWLHNQHQRRSENRLEQWKIEAINQVIPE